jgi:hypothetical protein
MIRNAARLSGYFDQARTLRKFLVFVQEIK